MKKIVFTERSFTVNGTVKMPWEGARNPEFRVGSRSATPCREALVRYVDRAVLNELDGGKELKFTATFMVDEPDWYTCRARIDYRRVELPASWTVLYSSVVTRWSNASRHTYKNLWVQVEFE